jgi:hypothetical protein
MKTVLWKPFRRWTGTLYSHFSSSYRDNRAKSSALHTTSQDPIVSSSLNGYQLQNMDLEKAQQSGRKQDLNILERAIAQLPGANHHNHPHHAPYKPTPQPVILINASDSRSWTTQVASTKKPQSTSQTHLALSLSLSQKDYPQ